MWSVCILQTSSGASLARSLTDDVSLAGGDGVLQLVWNHAELIFWCPVNGDGVVRRCAKLLADSGSIRSCDRKQNIQVTHMQYILKYCMQTARTLFPHADAKANALQMCKCCAYLLQYVMWWK